MPGQQQPTSNGPRRLFEPEQMIDGAINVLNHMRLQQPDEATAVEASLYMFAEMFGYLLVRSTATAESANRVLATLHEHLVNFVGRLNSVRGGEGVSLPPFEHPEYSGDVPRRKP